jgi:hypothetical protein
MLTSTRSTRSNLIAATFGVLGAVAILVATAVPGPFNSGATTLAGVGTTYSIPAWVNWTLPANVFGNHSGTPGVVVVRFNLTVDSRIMGTLLAPRPFGFVLGTPGWADDTLCELSRPPPPCAPPGGRDLVYLAGDSTSQINLADLSLGFARSNNVLPSGQWEMLLYNLNDVSDPVRVTSPIESAPVSWF